MKKRLFLSLAVVLLTMLNSSILISLPTSVKGITVSAAYSVKNTAGDTSKGLLIAGNKRFVENTPAKKDISEERRKELSTNGQKPFAVIVSCSDSRVPPELVFDQALGDLFVIRNAGNVSDPVVLGSVEYGAEHLKAPLIVVLGHEQCGAVKAALEGGEAQGNISSIVNRIRPVCEKIKTPVNNANELYDKCIDENIKNTVSEIKKSPIISRLEKENKVTVIGAKYHMESGKVVFQ